MGIKTARKQVDLSTLKPTRKKTGKDKWLVKKCESYQGIYQLEV